MKSNLEPGQQAVFVGLWHRRNVCVTHLSECGEHPGPPVLFSRQHYRTCPSPSTCANYNQKWRVFLTWCQRARVDRSTCPNRLVLRLLQSFLDSGRAASTIKVYTAAIYLFHEAVGGVTVGRHPLVSQFIKGACRLHPTRSPRAPSWTSHWCWGPWLNLHMCPLISPPSSSCLTKQLSSWLYVQLKSGRITRSVCEWGLFEVEGWWHWVSLWPNPAFLPKVVNLRQWTRLLRSVLFDPTLLCASVGTQCLHCTYSTFEVRTLSAVCVFVGWQVGPPPLCPAGWPILSLRHNLFCALGCWMKRGGVLCFLRRWWF